MTIFLEDCKNNLVNSQFKLFNQLIKDSFYLHQNVSNLSHINIKTYEIYILITFIIILFGLAYTFIRNFFKKDVKFNNLSISNSVELLDKTSKFQIIFKKKKFYKMKI